jgi:hypothetical protein
LAGPEINEKKLVRSLSMQQLTTSGFVQLYNESENVVVISGAGISAEILDVLFELIVDL